MIVIVCTHLAVNTSVAQVVGGRQIVVAELRAAQAASDSSIVIGIRFKIEPDWYLYWKNPGDAGLPISVHWVLPEGWKASPLRFPVPSKFVHGDIVAYGYKNELVLVATIVPAGPLHGVIHADLDWLVCRESCVRGKATVSLDTGVPGRSTWLTAALARMPEAGEELHVRFARPIVHKDDERWVFEIELEGEDAASVSDFYPESSGEVVLDYSSIRIANNRLSFILIKENKDLSGTVVSGLLLANGRGYEYSIPVRFSSF